MRMDQWMLHDSEWIVAASCCHCVCQWDSVGSQRSKFEVTAFQIYIPRICMFEAEVEWMSNPHVVFSQAFCANSLSAWVPPVAFFSSSCTLPEWAKAKPSPMPCVSFASCGSTWIPIPLWRIRVRTILWSLGVPIREIVVHVQTSSRMKRSTQTWRRRLWKSTCRTPRTRRSMMRSLRSGVQHAVRGEGVLEIEVCVYKTESFNLLGLGY